VFLAALFAALYIVIDVPFFRNQIAYMHSGEAGKITFGRIKYKFRTSINKNSRLSAIY